MIYLDKMGHLFSDKSVDELYEFAVNKLGLRPEWNHYTTGFPHFDLITKSKMDLAKKFGAKYIDDRRELVKITLSIKSLYPPHGPGAIPFVKGVGLNNQPILRVDFKKYFKNKDKFKLGRTCVLCGEPVQDDINHTPSGRLCCDGCISHEDIFGEDED